MPTSLTYDAPGQYADIGPEPLKGTFIVHTQVTLRAPSARKTLTTCRQAATHTAGGVCDQPHEYQLPLGSGANDSMTGSVSERTWAASSRSCASAAPEVTFAIETLPGMSWRNGVAPLAISC